MEQLNQNFEKLVEQLSVANNQRYGRSSEKLSVIDGQMTLDMIFNEAEALTENLYMVEPTEEQVLPARKKKTVGKREADLKGLPVETIAHKLTTEKLTEIFGANGWKELPDEIYHRVRVKPAEYWVEEHHVGVYAGKDNQTIPIAKDTKRIERIAGMVQKSINESIEARELARKVRAEVLAV